MAILDKFEVTVLTPDRLISDRSRTHGPRWVEVDEHSPPGLDAQEPGLNTCRRYIGVPPFQCLDSGERVSTEFVIDYKIKCGFVFPDQHETGAEYIVFRTYLDGEKIGGASVSRKRWERSGTYRQRKQGRRYRVENEYRWIRQRWIFDPGLHGTLKVEVWRERTRIPTINDWGFIDLTGDDDLVIGQHDLPAIVHEPSAKQPRVKNMVKLDLLPLATFEFEYRSSETLRLLGVAELDLQAELDVSTQQQVPNHIPMEESTELWRTLTSTSSSGDTFDTTTEVFSDDMGSYGEQRSFSCGNTPAQNSSHNPVDYTDAIGRSLLTGWSTTASALDHLGPSTSLMHSGGYGESLPILEGNWWAASDAPLKAEDLQGYGKADLVDLTMVD